MGKKYGILIICAAILFLCFVEAASARTWHVDDDGGADFTRIQDAITSANGGDTITVRDGIYIENIKVGKRLTIQSENGSDPTIVRAEDPDEHVFNVTADYVNISGFTVEGPTGWPNAGIKLYNAEYCNITNNTCSNNGNGIYLSRSDNNNISNNNCSQNNRHGICLHGTILWGSYFNSITNNNCSNNKYDGIYLWCSSQNSIANNDCSNNKYDGIRFDDSRGSSIINNIANNNNDDGIELNKWSDKSSIANNNCSNNGDDGIALWNSKNNCISKNNCSNNKDDGIYFSNSNNNFIYLNNFIDNSDNVDSYDSTNIWNSTEEKTYTYKATTYTNYLGNYWNDYTGSDTDGGGIGDTPYPIYSDKDDYPLMQPFENYI